MTTDITRTLAKYDMIRLAVLGGLLATVGIGKSLQRQPFEIKGAIVEKVGYGSADRKIVSIDKEPGYVENLSDFNMNEGDKLDITGYTKRILGIPYNHIATNAIYSTK